MSMARSGKRKKLSLADNSDSDSDSDADIDTLQVDTKYAEKFEDAEAKALRQKGVRLWVWLGCPVV